MAALEETRSAVEIVMFENIRKTYVYAREEQRRKIIDYMNCHDFKWEKKGKKVNVSYSGGMGKENYRGEKTHRIGPTYDLRIWKWIEAYKNDKYYFISLQAFDQDPKSGNYHVLLDRIGIFVCDEKLQKEMNGPKRDGETNKDVDERKQMFNGMITSGMEMTAIDLPMDDKKLKELVQLLDKKAKQ